MAKWVKIGGALLALAWAPFLYKEIANEAPEQPERALPEVAFTQDDTTALHAAAEPEPEAPTAQLPPAAAAEDPQPADPSEPAAAPVAAAPVAAAPVAAAPVPSAVPTVAQPAAAPTPNAEQVEQLAAVAAAPPAAPEGEEPAVEGEEADEPEPTPPTASGPADALKQAYDQQPRDALWAADVERKLGALFGNDDVPADLLRSASCRKAVCRVELRWTTAHATAYVSAYEAIQKLGGEVGVEPVGTPSEQGEQQVNLYLTRKGYTLADL